MALPIPNQWYFLVPQCAQDMALGAIVVSDTIPGASSPDQYYSLVLRPMSDRSPFQRFQAYAYGDAGSSGYGFAFYTDYIQSIYGLAKFVLMYSLDGNSPLVLQDWRNFSTAGTWNLIPYGDFYAVQNAYDTDQNLNVAGDGPYPVNTQILTWNWSGGAPNEIWKFVEFDSTTETQDPEDLTRS
jgi:hypothetical protein